MHSVAEIGSNVPAFLGKLWKMVEDPETNDLIAWSSAGTSFVIKDEIRFARELLPMYYKHNNMASFIRQLNMYGFHKIVSPDAGSMKLETPDEIKFTHPYFIQGHPYLLDNIKRKIGVNKMVPGQMGEKTPQVINKVLSDVRQMKGRQENMDSRLAAMKMENMALWRELSILRKKHNKQQAVVNKLINFLVSIVNQNRGSFSVKRNFQRMLQHKPTTDDLKIDDHEGCSNASNSPTGPIIHELDSADFLDTVVEETNSDTTLNASDYFLDQSNESTSEMVVDVEIPNSVATYVVNDKNAETIFGMSEDNMVPNINKQPTNNSGVDNDVPNYVCGFSPKKTQKELEVPKPKYVKLVARKLKRIDGNEQGAHQSSILIPATPAQGENKIQKQLEMNKQEIIAVKQKQHQNQQQLLKSDQKKMVKNGYLIQKHKQTQKNQPGVKSQLHLKLNQRQQHLSKNQQELLKPQQLMRHHQETQKPQQDDVEQSNSGILLQTLKLPSPQPTSEPIVTVPFDDCGLSADVITDVNSVDLEPLYVEAGNEGLSVPVVVEVPPVSGSSVQPSPPAVSPQDLLISSPMMINDPVMTPHCEPVVTPLTTPPEANNEMQVACAEDSQLTSPTIVTRSEMDNHLESVQSDLDNLKELLHSEGISLDANTLLGYLNDDPLSYNMSHPVDSDEPKENMGNELMTCNQSLFDLTDLMGNDWSLPTSPAHVPTDDSFAEVNTPQFVPHSPSFPTAAKKRKK